MNKEALSQHFQSRHGRELNETRHIYLPNPDKLHTMKDLTYHGSQAARYAAEFRAMIETMETYQQLIYDRVQALTQAQYHMEIHLRRERRYYNDNKVFYYLEAVKVYDTPGIEAETIERTTYPGTERRKAIADFAAYQKSHPGIIAVKDIEKGKWER